MADAVVVSAGPLARIDRVRGVVHAVYPGSVYIATTDGPLLVVHGPGYGHTPTSLVVAGARRDEWGAARGDVVTGKLGYLRFGSTLLDARQARVWQPRRAVHRVAAASAETLRAIVREIPGDAMARLHSACRRLVTVLAADDATAVRAGTRALVGNGPGLTPSGDDALVGLFAVLHRVGPTERCSDALRLLAESVDALLRRTTRSARITCSWRSTAISASTSPTWSTRWARATASVPDRWPACAPPAPPRARTRWSAWSRACTSCANTCPPVGARKWHDDPASHRRELVQGFGRADGDLVEAARAGRPRRRVGRDGDADQPREPGRRRPRAPASPPPSHRTWWSPSPAPMPRATPRWRWPRNCSPSSSRATAAAWRNSRHRACRWRSRGIRR